MDLKKKADSIRNEVIKVSFRNKKGHIASSLSCLEILVALYYRIMDENDHFIFSKAHGCYSLYAILADKGYIAKQKWNNFALTGCAKTMNGLSFANGSLGHGLPIAVGIAYGLKLNKKEGNVFCIVGDGEMQEGSNWEAIQFAVKYSLNNLTIIVDNNRLQAMDFIVNIMDKDEKALDRKFIGFGLSPWHCSGNDVDQIAYMLSIMTQMKSIEPNLLMADTTKGKGIPCMENSAKFHYRIPSCI